MALKDHRSDLTGVLLATVIAGMQPIPAYASFWDDLWKTPYQQNLELEQQGDFEALTEIEDSPAWSGVGHYRAGDYAEAAEKFASSADSAGTYNRATALTQAGEYDEAIKLFDQILTENPDDEKAAHNRSIAEQLAQLQQQQQEQEGDGQEGDNQDGDKQDGQQQESGQQNSDQQDSDGDTEQEQDGQSGSDQQQQQQQEQQAANEEQSEQSESDRQEEQQQAENAGTEEPSPTEETADDTQQMQPLNEAMTENQQATEQWLRRIPDDPTGLLRRKLQRSHATDFPGVVDGASPW